MTSIGYSATIRGWLSPLGDLARAYPAECFDSRDLIWQQTLWERRALGAVLVCRSCGGAPINILKDYIQQ